MPKRKDVNTILLIGSGPIVIGQACEFDYSGTCAAKTLKNEGYRVVLINSNPATIMTDPEFADRTYIEPIKEEYVEEIIKKEKIDAILPTMGGQTALNVAMSLYNKGKLNNIKFLGAKPDAIKKGEDRKSFKELMIKIGLDVPISKYAYTMDEAFVAYEKIKSNAVIVRSSFTLGGEGSGIAHNKEDFEKIARRALDASPINEILIEESLLGFKEYEMEVIRDSADNCIIVCSIENLDPMGVHTGDSITVAPAQTLTDKEYQRMRDASFKILREIGVDTGGSNVQFAVDPDNGRLLVIEMNPRVSRSSALASKATGYPIAKVATLLALGYTLDEIKNDITNTPASFEPVMDYVVTKIPRFTFEKFPEADSSLNTSMKSVGEVMAIGASFKESLQKAFCSLEKGFDGLDGLDFEDYYLKKEISRANCDRLRAVGEGFRRGFSLDEIYNLSKIDRWFLYQIKELIDFEKLIDINILKDEELFRKAKVDGFSDNMIIKLIAKNSNLKISLEKLREAKEKLNIYLDYREVDTCAGEFESITPYFYSSMSVSKELKVSKRKSSKPKVLIIGSGPNRIGQGIEFDYCCVHASFALREMGVETIMYNCNPETVSTDYDISDVLYFEPIDFERVRELILREEPDGVIIHFGGQTPLKLARSLEDMNANILGTPAKVIDLAEDREKFSAFIKKHKLKQAKNASARNLKEAIAMADEVGYPVLLRPSYVLGGKSMAIAYESTELEAYIQKSINFDSPLLIDKFLNNALEIDVDAVCDGKDLYIASIVEHIEEAGIHSGDSACVLPALSLCDDMVRKIQDQTKLIALNLGIVGLLNIQFAIYESELYILEVNPRASRTVPFLSKATGLPLAKIATRVMYKQSLKEAISFYDKKNIVKDYFGVYKPKINSYVAVKESVFPFSKLLGSKVELSPEMKSTGEVMGISSQYHISFAKAQEASGNKLPLNGTVFLSVQDADKNDIIDIAKDLLNLNFDILATDGTHKVLLNEGVKSLRINKINEGNRPNVKDYLIDAKIDLVINTISLSKHSKDDHILMRQSIVSTKVPYFTTIAEAKVVVKAIETLRKSKGLLCDVKSLQEYLD